jgi:hypothetical protein
MDTAPSIVVDFGQLGGLFMTIPKTTTMTTGMQRMLWQKGLEMSIANSLSVEIL